jgi:hypothetical protein
VLVGWRSNEDFVVFLYVWFNSFAHQNGHSSPRKSG